MKKFAKYHGCGNDFLITNMKDMKLTDLRRTAIDWCHRNTGIGADGLIIVNEKPEKDIPVEMIIYNSDGSLAPMCGNGIRCFAQYCSDEGIVKQDIYPVKTGAGTMIVAVQSRKPFEVEIDMGKPDFDPGASAVDTKLPAFIDQKIEVAPDTYEVVSTFFMGTVHTIVWDTDMGNSYINQYGRFDEPVETNAAVGFIGFDPGEAISNDPIFKEKTNVNFVKPLDRQTIKLTTYERGAGLTAACGTGACASVVYGIRTGKLDNRVKVLLPYGELVITQKEDGTVFMQGPSEKIAEGQCLL